MSDCTKSVTGRIDGLVCRLRSTPEGDELLTVQPDTGRATLATYPAGRPGLTLFGRLRWPYLILDRSHDGKRWVRLAAVLTASMWLGGCTAEMTMHYPGKMNAIDTHQSGRTTYRGSYQPPYPMDPPAESAWKGMDLGLRN